MMNIAQYSQINIDQGNRIAAQEMRFGEYFEPRFGMIDENQGYWSMNRGNQNQDWSSGSNQEVNSSQQVPEHFDAIMEMMRNILQGMKIQVDENKDVTKRLDEQEVALKSIAGPLRQIVQQLQNESQGDMSNENTPNLKIKEKHCASSRNYEQELRQAEREEELRNTSQMEETIKKMEEMMLKKQAILELLMQDNQQLRLQLENQEIRIGQLEQEIQRKFQEELASDMNSKTKEDAVCDIQLQECCKVEILKGKVQLDEDEDELNCELLNLFNEEDLKDHPVDQGQNCVNELDSCTYKKLDQFKIEVEDSKENKTSHIAQAEPIEQLEEEVRRLKELVEQLQESAKWKDQKDTKRECCGYSCKNMVFRIPTFEVGSSSNSKIEELLNNSLAVQQEAEPCAKGEELRTDSKNLRKKRKMNKKKKKKKAKAEVDEKKEEMTKKKEECSAAKEKEVQQTEIISIPHNLINALMTGTKNQIRFKGMKFRLKAPNISPDPT